VSEFSSISYGPETWSKGHRGLLGAHATDKPGLHNVRMAKDGSLLPRPPWEYQDDFSVPFIPGGVAVWGDEIVVAEIDFDASNRFVSMYDTDADKVRQGTMDRNAPSGIGGVPTLIDDGTLFWGSYVFTKDGGGGVVVFADTYSGVAMGVDDARDSLIPTFYTGADTWNFRGSALHQSRAFYFGTYQPAVVIGAYDDQSNRIWYSDAHDYTNFSDDTQFFEVDGAVAGMISIRSNLFIWTEEGQWYVLQGRGDPADGTLNDLGPGRVPAAGRYPRVIDNSAIFLSSDETTICSLSATGTIDDTTLGHLGASSVAQPSLLSGGNEPLSPVTDSFANTILVPDLENVRANYHGVWTQETWLDELIPDTGGWMTVGSDYRGAQEIAAVRSGVPNYLVYTRPIHNDRPHDNVVVDNHLSTVVLPRVVMPGAQLRIVRLHIDVRTWSATDPLPFMEVTITDGDNNVNSTNVGPDLDIFTGVGEGEESLQVLVTSGLDAFTHFADVSIDFRGLAIERVLLVSEHHEEPLL